MPVFVRSRRMCVLGGGRLYVTVVKRDQVEGDIFQDISFLSVCVSLTHTCMHIICANTFQCALRQWGLMCGSNKGY